MIWLLQILASLATLGLGLHLLRWDQLVAGASKIDFASFSVALCLALSSVAAIGLRWIYIVRRLAPAPLRVHWRIYCLGTFFNSFTPVNVGGDLYRVVALRPWLNNRAVSKLLAAVVVERILGLWSFLFGYLVAVVLYVVIHPLATTSLSNILLWPAGPTALIVAGIMLLPRVRPRRLLPSRFRSYRLMRQLRSFEVGMRLAVAHGLRALGGLSVLAWVAWVATVSVVATRLNLDLSIALLAAIVSLTEIIRLIPISFQGIGIREGAFAALVGLAGGAPEAGFVVATVAYAAMSLALVFSGIAGGLLGLGGIKGERAPATSTQFNPTSEC